MGLISVQKAAEHLEVSERTLYRLINRGSLIASKVGGQWRISTDEINRYLKDNQKKRG
jgi:excisionase family DNA binding protein